VAFGVSQSSISPGQRAVRLTGHGSRASRRVPPLSELQRLAWSGRPSHVRSLRYVWSFFQTSPLATRRQPMAWGAQVTRFRCAGGWTEDRHCYAVEDRVWVWREHLPGSLPFEPGERDGTRWDTVGVSIPRASSTDDQP